MIFAPVLDGRGGVSAALRDYPQHPIERIMDNTELTADELKYWDSTLQYSVIALGAIY